MSSKALRRRTTIIGILLTVVFLAATSFKATLQDAALLEVNAHLIDLMASPHSFLLAAPAPIAGRALSEDGKEGASFKKALVANDSLDSWFERSKTQALIVQKEGQIVYQRYSSDAGDGRNINAMSMVKAIIAILVGVAIDDGFIDSEYDSVSQYLPQIAERAGDPVTLRDLLRHTSGIETESKDIWATLPDVFASSSNYLKESGWNDDLTWGREVMTTKSIPDSFITTSAKEINISKPLSEWAALGILKKNGDKLPIRDIQAYLVYPEGDEGRKFLVYENFKVIMNWNRSLFFGLSVGILSDMIEYY